MWLSAKEYIKRKYDKPGEAYLSTLQRLDRPVSGVCMFAKTGVAAERIAKDLSDRAVTKE
jgi:23S rRNA pseudouridine1911/1915/1917 synthase